MEKDISNWDECMKKSSGEYYKRSCTTGLDIWISVWSPTPNKYRNLRITLKYERKLHHIDSPLPGPPAANAIPEQVAAYQALLVEQDKVALLMQLNACKMEEVQSVSSHILKMKSYTNKLEHLRHPMPHVLASLGELHAMLKTAEKNVSYKSVVPSLHMIREGGVKKKSQKKGKGKSKDRKKFPPPPKQESVAKNVDCFYYGPSFLNVSSGMKLCLEQCHYTPSITRDLDGVISIDKCVFHVAKRTKKMTKNHFSDIGNRVEDLLGLMYIVVCCPFRVPTRDGDTYFDFLDHLVECGIVSQRTSPYTPQHNGGYALEIVARILNMVPTKKVEKTPYEIWHGKAPKLSFMRVKVWLRRCFAMKDFGEATYILGIKIYRDRSSYLRRTKDMFLVYGGLVDELSVKAYTDASFQTDQYDTKSQSGYVFVMNCRAMKKFIDELGVVPSIENSVKVYVEVIKVHIDDNIVDPLTKSLPCDKHMFHANEIGLRYIGLE
ncbi:retrotransposon protein, putative, ty1-copia subclass [Tanacetum coccineum]